MKVTAARNLHSLQKAMIEVKKTKGTDILTVTFINSKIQNVIQNQGFINKKLSINEYVLHIMTSTNAFLEHCHTLEHFKISAMDKEETGMFLNHHVCLDYVVFWLLSRWSKHWCTHAQCTMDVD